MNPKTIMPPEIINVATLVKIAERKACRFVWRDSEKLVGLLSYVDGRYTEHHRVSRLTGKHIWRKMLKHDWVRLTAAITDDLRSAAPILDTNQLNGIGQAAVSEVLNDNCALVGTRSSIQDMVEFSNSI